MDTRTSSDSVDSEAVLFFADIVKEKLVDQTMVDVKYVQGHLGQAQDSIQKLIKVTYKNQLLKFFKAHPERFAVYGQNVCLFKAPSSSVHAVPVVVASPTSAMPPVDTASVSSFAEEASIGFVSAAIHHRGPQSINRLCGQYSQMALQMREYIDAQVGTSLQKKLECVLLSRPNIFGISSNGTASLSGRPLWLRNAEQKGLECMCRHVIGNGHMHLDTLLTRLKQQCNHLVHTVLDDVSQDSLEDFLCAKRDCFFFPDFQNVWTIKPHDRLQMEEEKKVVSFFKQEISHRAESIDYTQLLHAAEKSDVVLNTGVKDSVHIGKILWCHDHEFVFSDGKVSVAISESSDISEDSSLPACRQDASQKAHKLHGLWLADYKGIISNAFKHTMVIMATLKGSPEESFEVHCQCRACEVVDEGETKDHLCQVLRKGDEVTFSAIYDDAEDPDNPNKPLWSAVRVAKVLPERPESMYKQNDINSVTSKSVGNGGENIFPEQSGGESVTLEQGYDELHLSMSTGTVIVVGQNSGILQTGEGERKKNVYFDLNKVEGGSSELKMGQRVYVEFENSEVTVVRLISNTHERHPSTEDLPAAEGSMVEYSQVHEATMIKDFSHDVVEEAAVPFDLQARGGPTVTVPESVCTDTDKPCSGDTMLNIFGNLGSFNPNIMPQIVQDKLLAMVTEELLHIAAEDPEYHGNLQNILSDSAWELQLDESDGTGLMKSVACQTLFTGPILAATSLDESLL